MKKAGNCSHKTFESKGWYVLWMQKKELHMAAPWILMTNSEFIEKVTRKKQKSVELDLCLTKFF